MRSFKKVGILFLALVIALAGIGGAFAAWTTDVTFEGTVKTGTVEFEPILYYSGMDVYKTDDHGIEVVSGWLPLDPLEPDPETGFPKLIGSAYGQAGTGDYDVEFVYDNIFPCLWWCADFAVHYVGTVPVMVTIMWEGLPEGMSVQFTVCWYDTGEPVEMTEDGYWQMHNCDWVVVKACVYVEQDDDLQGETFTFSGKIHATQWNVCNDNNNNDD